MKKYAKYVNVSQVIAGNSFKHIDDYRAEAAKRGSVERYLKESDEPIFAGWGSGTWEVNEDGTLGDCISSNWDSSD